MELPSADTDMAASSNDSRGLATTVEIPPDETNTMTNLVICDIKEKEDHTLNVGLDHLNYKINNNESNKSNNYKTNNPNTIGNNQYLNASQASSIDGGEDAKKMFVGGLSPTTNEDSLMKYFIHFGEIINLTIKYDPISKRSKGYGFLTFKERDSVDKIISIKEHILDGRNIDPKRLETKRASDQGGRTKKIFVGGVPTDMSKDRLEEYFGSKGEIDEVALVTNKSTNLRRGFVFITFKNERIVDELVQERYHFIDGHQVEVKKATPRDQNNFSYKFNRAEPQNMVAVVQPSLPRGSPGGASTTFYSQFTPAFYSPYQFGYNPYAYSFHSPYTGNLYGPTPNTQTYDHLRNNFGATNGSFHPYR